MSRWPCLFPPKKDGDEVMNNGPEDRLNSVEDSKKRLELLYEKLKIKDAKELLDRRQFFSRSLDWVLGVSVFISGGFGAALIWKYLEQPKISMEGETKLGWIYLGRTTEFSETPRKVYYGEEPVYIHFFKRKLVALSAICPHVRCTVIWNPTGKPNPRNGSYTFDCPCHVSSFDIGGRRLYGPAPRGLYAHRLKVVGDKVYLGNNTRSS
jgi:nitrite reductase/ring-hydroxylating ferredoxin subunit